MGGYSPTACATTSWRGVTVCQHSVLKLNAWARATGSVYLKPIQGCYHPGLAASAGTHDRGGVYDIEADGLSLADFNMLVNTGRKVLLITEGRWWDGNHHVHLIDPECPDLAPLAADQVEQFRAGETGLVGHADRDTWDRSTADAILRVYDNRGDVKPASTGGAHRAPRTYTIPRGGTLGAAAAILGASVGALASWNHISNPNVVHPGQVITAPPSGYKATATPSPAPRPAPKPTPRPAAKPSANPVPAPAHAPRHAAPAPARPAPKPVANTSRGGFRPIGGQSGVYTHLLREGVGNSTSVYRYEQALAHAGYLGRPWASDGYYGTSTSAATRDAYRRLGVTPWATSPGPYLLRVLHVPVAGS